MTNLDQQEKELERLQAELKRLKEINFDLNSIVNDLKSKSSSESDRFRLILTSIQDKLPEISQNLKGFSLLLDRFIGEYKKENHEETPQ